MEFPFEKEVRSGKNGLDQIGKLEKRLRGLSSGELKLNFDKTDFFDAHLCAGLGAILSQAEENLNEIKFNFRAESRVERVLRKNGFMSAFGEGSQPDIYRTTIKYEKFKANEPSEFKKYLSKYLFSLESLSNLPEDLRKKISKSLIEVFDNAFSHTGCKSVFSCGQIYPNEGHIDFSIANLGKTIYDNVSAYLKASKVAEDKELLEDIGKKKKPAISWAVKDGHTTRIGFRPGGFGLSELRKFLKETKGRLQIYSEDEFWEERYSQSETTSTNQSRVKYNRYKDIKSRSRPFVSSILKGTVVILRFQFK